MTTKRPQSLGEEIANAASHGVGVLAAFVALPVLVVGAARNGDAAAVVGASVFGGTLAMLYLALTLYHALPASRSKRVFLVLDHCAIYLLIAGTYTPFTLGVLRGAWGWSLFGVVWGLAMAGVVFKCLAGERFRALSTALYVAMGWLVVLAIRPLREALPADGIGWLVAGGLAYTLGVVFFALDSRVRFAHLVWHLFVMAGSVCHVVAVYRYAGAG